MLSDGTCGNLYLIVNRELIALKYTFVVLTDVLMTYTLNSCIPT